MKIFGIGAHKTGTTTLERCLAYLDFLPQAAWANSSFLTKNWAEADYAPIIRFAKAFCSFSDSPWNHSDFYRLLDQQFPRSKFILTIRDDASWFDSLRRWLTPEGSDKTSISSLPFGVEYHSMNYGMTEDSFDDYEDHYRFIYNRRNFEIQQYFSDRPSDLLVIDWTKAGWEELCGFLGSPIPDKPIPHLNKGRQ